MSVPLIVGPIVLLRILLFVDESRTYLHFHILVCNLVNPLECGM